MREYVEFSRLLALQCLCVMIVFYPVARWVPVPDEWLALSVGFLIGSGTWLQFERHRHVRA